jgi:hypothetical protein
VGTGVALGPHADRKPAIDADRTMVIQARFSIGFSFAIAGDDESHRAIA